MTDDNEWSKSIPSKSKSSSTQLHANTYYIKYRNRIIYDCAYRLAKSSSFKSLLINHHCENIYDHDNNGKRTTIFSVSSAHNKFTETIYDRIVKKISSDDFLFRSNYVMHEELTSNIDIIAERIDMQCFHLYPHDVKISKVHYCNENGISIGQYMKRLVNKLLAGDKGKNQERSKRDINDDDKGNDKNILYLQTILLLSRAPVQSLRQRSSIIEKSGILPVVDFSVKNTQDESVRNDSKNEDKIDEIDFLNLTEWKKYFAEEEILDCDNNTKWALIKEELENDIYDVETLNIPNISTNKKRKSSASYVRPTQIDQNIELQPEKYENSEAPLDSESNFEILLPMHCPDKLYGSEAIDEIQNYILLQKSRESDLTFHGIQSNYQDDFEEDCKDGMNTSIGCAGQASLYISHANKLWQYLYKSKFIPHGGLWNKDNLEMITSYRQLPSAVSIISEVELCQALVSTFRGLSNSYFFLVSSTSKLKSNFNKIELQYDDASQPSNLLNIYDYCWTLQAPITHIWPITTSLSHEAVFSILTHALRELADPVTVIREFCDIDSCIENTSIENTYVTTSQVFTAFRNCLYECILRPFELQVTNYESNMYNAISLSTTNSSIHYQVGTILGLTHLFTLQWSKSLRLARNLINGAFPSWRFLTSCTKNKLNASNNDEHSNARYSTTCLDFLYTMVQEENLLNNFHCGDFGFEDGWKENEMRPLSLTSALFSASLLAYCKLLEKWVLEGSLYDPIGELFISKKTCIGNDLEFIQRTMFSNDFNSKMEMHDKLEWINLQQINHNQNLSQKSYVYMLRHANGVIPRFLQTIANDIFWCGIHIYIIRYGDQSFAHSQLEGYRTKTKNSKSRLSSQKQQKQNMTQNKYNQLLAEGLTTCVISKMNNFRITMIENDEIFFGNKFSFLIEDDITLLRENRQSYSSHCNEISNEHNLNEVEEVAKRVHKNTSKASDDNVCLNKDRYNFFTFDIQRKQIYEKGKNEDFNIDRMEVDYSHENESPWNDNTKFEQLNQLGLSKPRIESLLLDNLRLQCSAAGNELYHMFWNSGRFRKDLCSNLSLYEHIIAIHKVYCISDPDIISSFSTELFSFLDELGHLHMRFMIEKEGNSLRFDQLLSSIRISSTRMTSLLRSSIENQYHDMVNDFKKKNGEFCNQNHAYNMLIKASIEVIDFGFENQQNVNTGKKCIEPIDTLDILQNLRLTLTPSWPMNIILHKYHLEKYGMIFVLLMQIKYCLYVCDQFWIERECMDKVVNKANQSNASISDERRKYALYSKIMHVVRCFHVHCMSITTKFASIYGRRDGQIQSIEGSNRTKGLKNIMLTQNQLIEKMMSHCLLLPQDKVLLSYMKKILSDGVKILFILRDMKRYDGNAIYEAYKKALIEIEDRWNQNLKSFLPMLDQMHISMDNGKVYEELLIKLRFNNYL